MKIRLQRVQYIPKTLEPGVLYVSEEFGAVAHLCACGCGAKIRTPLGPTDWEFEVTPSGPTLRPSIGNWQQACQSHYWILRGEIIWAESWTHEQIAAGQRAEEIRRQTYYDALDSQHHGVLQTIWHWFKGIFGR